MKLYHNMNFDQDVGCVVASLTPLKQTIQPAKKSTGSDLTD